MRISGNEPSSVILSQTNWFQNLNSRADYDRELALNYVNKTDGAHYTSN